MSNVLLLPFNRWCVWMRKPCSVRFETGFTLLFIYSWERHNPPAFFRSLKIARSSSIELHWQNKLFLPWLLPHPFPLPSDCLVQPVGRGANYLPQRLSDPEGDDTQRNGLKFESKFKASTMLVLNILLRPCEGNLQSVSERFGTFRNKMSQEYCAQTCIQWFVILAAH